LAESARSDAIFSGLSQRLKVAEADDRGVTLFVGQRIQQS
jgi:hypothetical protein